MKDKIMYFIIGILIGSIMTTTGFLIYNKTLKNLKEQQTMQMDENNQMQAPSGENMGQPPAKPEGDNGEEPPAKPNQNNSEESPTLLENLNNTTNS